MRTLAIGVRCSVAAKPSGSTFKNAGTRRAKQERSASARPPHESIGPVDGGRTRSRELHQQFGFLWSIKIGAGLMIGGLFVYLLFLLLAFVIGAILGVTILSRL